MIDFGIIVTGSIGIVSSIVSGWAAWFFARKKYESEVEHSQIENMQESLEFYQKLSDDYERRLDVVLGRSKKMEEEVSTWRCEVEELRKKVLNLTATICTDLSCQLRKYDYSKKGSPKTKKINES